MLIAATEVCESCLGEAWFLLAAFALASGGVCMAAGATASGSERPPVVCELYAPGHFGNWYEVAGIEEMRRALVEAKHWGFTRYGDWFDTLDCVDPFVEERQYDLGNALWDNKKAHFRTAQSLGLACDLIITPNHVYRDQLRPEWLAKTGDRIFGQLICPSKPEARQAILKNYENLFTDLAAAGVRLSWVSLCPYDYGGCACKACQPWIKTFARLSHDIYKIGVKAHPGLQLQFVGWWWSKEEHEIFTRWADSEAPGLVKSLPLHIPYGHTKVGNVPLPKGCQRGAFVHVGYADKARPRDIYGHLGPVIAAGRLAKTVADLREQGVTVAMAYSEGVFEDVNKALLGGLFTGRYTDPEAVLVDYASRYFGATPAQAKRWATWLAAWGEPFDRDAEAALKALETLPGDKADWRRRQWELKAEMMMAHRAIGQGRSWTPERLGHVRTFFAAQEACHRGLWGLGPQRHIFSRRFTPLGWYRSWAKHQAHAAGRLSAEQ